MASIFPGNTRPVINAIVQEASLKRSGLVADVILPQVQTPCAFEYIDWTSSLTVKEVNDAVTCRSNVHEVDPVAFLLKQGKVQDHALEQAMGECCISACGDDAALAAKKEATKTLQLMNRMLIAREKRAIAIAIDESKYTANGTEGAPVVPGAPTAVNEGGLYFITAANMASTSFALLKWFQPIQTGNWVTGRRNVAVMTQNTLNLFLSHPNFIGAGYNLDPLSTQDKVASLLGVQKIVVADAGYNNGVGTAVNMQGFFPDNYILFTVSYGLNSSDELQASFGITAYNKGFRVNYRIAEEKGPDAGVEMQKQSHDLTEVVLTYKAATLVKIV